MQHLEREYVFEFAGMPQSGKTIVKDILVHYLKRMEYPFEQFNGGSRNSPLYYAPIGELNQSLAVNIANFVKSHKGDAAADHKLYLLDKGLIDRWIFTEALLRDRQISQEQAGKAYQTLLLPDILKKLDEVFIFVTSAETALMREYEQKLVLPYEVRSQGDVMNFQFLATMQQVTIEKAEEARKLVRHVTLIHTEDSKTNMQDKAKEIFNIIRERNPELKFLRLASQRI